MSQNFHVIPYELLPGQKYDAGTNTLILDNAGVFNVTIKEYAEELEALEEQIKKKYEKRHFLEQFNKSLKPGSEAYIDYKKNVATLDKEIADLQDNKSKLKEKYTPVEWAWQLVSNGIKEGDITHNAALGKGLTNFTSNVNSVKSHLELSFNKLLEGGGAAWLEAFTKDDAGKGMHSNGMLVRAKGKPMIVRAEWTDFDYKKITKTIGFGSKVLLHIYTKALYGQKLEIQLIDQDIFDSNDVLEVSKKTKITEKVGVYKAHPAENGKYGVAGTLVNATKNDGAKEQYIQKIVVEVMIDYAWAKVAGETLKIFPTLQLPTTATYFKEYERSYLSVKMGEPVVEKPMESGNKPLMVGGSEAVKSDGKKTIDFTFGVFIDGTLNNMYNTEARQKFEAKQGVLHNQKAVEIAGEKKYRYKDQSSYENDLSNPAIIYKNYVEDKKNENHPIFKIYTEGIGTQTKPNENGTLEDEDYKNDSKIGYAIGAGATGIKKKVRQACEDMAKNITSVMSKKAGYVVGTVTVDVFGFSRGAAAARNFVHEITYPSYPASAGIENFRCDQHGYKVSEKYFTETLLPSNGHLGYMLVESKLGFKKLNIRFAGIYDTVPHHGAVQSNDAVDLGLHSIDKADYVVHMVADDEHRANFSLVKIGTVHKTPPNSGKKGGIELFMPGVHCDVGGSYVDEKPENKIRIDHVFYPELKKLKQELVAQGWFQDYQLYFMSGNTEVTDDNADSRLLKIILNSRRAAVSNQYSFIPLHLMAEFCKMKKVIIDENNILDIYKFTNKGHINGNVEFLNRIKQRLHAYAFDGASKFDYIPADQFHQPALSEMKKNDFNAKMEHINAQIAGQQKLNEIALQKNHDIMFLRNNHLHWNSVYGDGFLNGDFLINAYAPDIDKNGKRKRTVQ
jgi:hypothetical protein